MIKPNDNNIPYEASSEAMGDNVVSTDVAANLAMISARMNIAQDAYARLCAALGRAVSEVVLVAVSKRQPEVLIDAALAAGQRVFGENRVQEAIAHWIHRREDYPDLVLHLIGPLQTNKVNYAVALFDVIEVVDRPKLARALAREVARQNRHIDFYIQVNTGEEPQKAGVAPGDVDDFIRQCRDEFGLNVVGLMCIPPVDEEAAMHFALLKTIARRNGLARLSMGMSDDFEEAIGFGATSVRVGSAIFGAREI